MTIRIVFNNKKYVHYFLPEFFISKSTFLGNILWRKLLWDGVLTFCKLFYCNFSSLSVDKYFCCNTYNFSPTLSLNCLTVTNPPDFSLLIRGLNNIFLCTSFSAILILPTIYFIFNLNFYLSIGFNLFYDYVIATNERNDVIDGI